MIIKVLILMSAVSFLYYGLAFFTKSEMKDEFERYKLTKFRNFVGILQLLGGVGLLIGLAWKTALILSSGGLFLLMLIGFAVRVKMKDGFLDSMPSFVFAIINGYIFFATVGILTKPDLLLVF